MGNVNVTVGTAHGPNKDAVRPVGRSVAIKLWLKWAMSASCLREVGAATCTQVRWCSSQVERFPELQDRPEQQYHTSYKQAGKGRVYDKKPFRFECKQGHVYHWCACGFSHTQVWSTHEHTPWTSLAACRTRIAGRSFSRPASGAGHLLSITPRELQARSCGQSTMEGNEETP
ncbi:hypothetical protein HPB47_007303 [Ixodes persulcatus]|uniref:Uncharacterized protein n=1 Tax=Ixodes persulcatus TaxID=34615 RepID=A0AC60P7Y7_IXOPE|nr:hypothetical protein HPB47_007303 [Ixodes persulcatus]